MLGALRRVLGEQKAAAAEKGTQVRFCKCIAHEMDQGSPQNGDDRYTCAKCSHLGPLV